MGSVGFAFQLHDRRAIYDSIQQSHRQGCVAEIVGPRVEVDVGDQSGGALLAACIDDLVPQAGGLRAEAAFDAIEAELINNKQIELGVKADAIVDGLVGQSRCEVFEKSAAGDVVDFMTQGAGSLADALDETAFTDAALADEDEILTSADEVAGGERFDLDPADGGIEVPIELGERLKIAEAGVLDAALEAAFTPQSRLVSKQAVKEVEVRQAGVLSLLECFIKLVGGYGDA